MWLTPGTQRKWLTDCEPLLCEHSTAGREGQQSSGRAGHLWAASERQSHKSRVPVSCHSCGPVPTHTSPSTRSEAVGRPARILHVPHLRSCRSWPTAVGQEPSVDDTPESGRLSRAAKSCGVKPQSTNVSHGYKASSGRRAARVHCIPDRDPSHAGSGGLLNIYGFGGTLADWSTLTCAASSVVIRSTSGPNARCQPDSRSLLPLLAWTFGTDVKLPALHSRALHANPCWWRAAGGLILITLPWNWGVP
jgi:hypothetical protein